MGTGTGFSRLQEAIGFNVFDLQANRAGLISPAQHEQFIQQVKTAITQTLMLFILVSLVAVFTRQYAAFAGLPGIVGFMWWHLRARRLDDRNGTVLSVSGPTQLETYGGTHGTVNYRIRIGTMTFEHSEYVCRLFQEGVRYRVYYLPHSQQIVSVEEEESPMVDSSAQRYESMS